MKAITVLMWKEWRERRGEAVTLLAVGVLLPFGLAWVVELAKSVRGLAGIAHSPEGVLVMFWGLVGLLAAAPSLASERASRSLDFLLAQPMARRRVWLWKLASAFLFAAFVIGPSWAAYHVAAPSYWGPGQGMPVGVPGAMTPTAMLWRIAGGALLFFSAGMLASVLLEGTVLSMAMGGVIAFPVSILASPSSVEWAPAGMVFSAGLLVTSYVAFTAREYWPGRVRRPIAFAGLAWACLLSSGVGLEIARSLGILAWGEIVELRELVGPDEHGGLVLVCRARTGKSGIWTRDADGRWRHRLRCPDGMSFSTMGAPMLVAHGGREAVFDSGRAEVLLLKKPRAVSVRELVGREAGARMEEVEVVGLSSPRPPGSHLVCFACVRGAEWFVVEPWRTTRIQIPPDAVPLAWFNRYGCGMALYQAADGQLGAYQVGVRGPGTLGEVAVAADPGGPWKVWTLPTVGFVVQRSGSARVQIIHLPEPRQLHVRATEAIEGELLDAGQLSWDGGVGLVVRRADGLVDIWECRIDEKTDKASWHRLIEGKAKIACGDWSLRFLGVGSERQELGVAFVVAGKGQAETDGDLWVVRKGRAERLASGGFRAEARQCLLQGTEVVSIRNGRELWQFNLVSGVPRRMWP